MKTVPPLVWLAACLVCTTFDTRASEAAALSGGVTSTAEGDRFELQWSGQPGARYRVPSRTNLSDASDSWTTVDVVRADSNAVPVRWTAPEVPRQQHFCRLAGPDAEMFSVEPATAPPNAPVTLYLTGQCFGSHDTVAAEMGGCDFSNMNDHPCALVKAKLTLRIAADGSRLTIKNHPKTQTAR
jgi:hypothetical protein